MLLESLRHLSDSGVTSVHCHLYGPIYESVHDRFRDALERTPNALYKGILPGNWVIATMRAYDALVVNGGYCRRGFPIRLVFLDRFMLCVIKQ